MFFCSECFNDIGLKKEAKNIGIKNSSICSNWGNKKWYKLDTELLDDLCHNFFVLNNTYKFSYGESYYIQYNNSHYNNDDNIIFAENLKNDVEIFRQHLKIGFFYYPPRLCYLGENDYIHDFSAHYNSNNFKNAIKKLIEKSRTKYYNSKNLFYRLRKNPQNPTLISEYDSAPRGKGRFNKSNNQLLYASKSIKACIKECRVNEMDELYIATLKPVNKLKLLDLTNLNDLNDNDLFESIDFAVKLLINTNENSYKICRKIANFIQKQGFDGFISDSHFKLYLDNKAININILGSPIKENKVKVININRLNLNKVNYNISFGASIE